MARSPESSEIDEGPTDYRIAENNGQHGVAVRQYGEDMDCQMVRTSERSARRTAWDLPGMSDGCADARQRRVGSARLSSHKVLGSVVQSYLEDFARQRDGPIGGSGAAVGEVRALDGPVRSRTVARAAAWWPAALRVGLRRRRFVMVGRRLLVGGGYSGRGAAGSKQRSCFGSGWPRLALRRLGGGGRAGSTTAVGLTRWRAPE